MNFADWYTDLFTVERQVETKDGALTKKTWQTIVSDLKGRRYMGGGSTPRLNQTAADSSQTHKLACATSVDIREGDRITITVGAGLGHTDEIFQAFAGSPHNYYEPFGGIAPQLDHKEVELLEEKRIWISEQS